MASTVTAGSEIRLRDRGTWTANGPNGNGYQRYDSVIHEGSLYFTSTAIAAPGEGEDPVTPALDSMVWKIMAVPTAGSTTQGSIVYHDGARVTTLAPVNETLLAVHERRPAFRTAAQIPDATAATFSGYRLNTDVRSTGGVGNILILNKRTYFNGFFPDEMIARESGSVNLQTALPMVTPLDADVDMDKVYSFARCSIAIGEDATKVYAMGLDVGRFGMGDLDQSTNPLTPGQALAGRLKQGYWHQITYFDTNDIEVEKAMTTSVVNNEAVNHIADTGDNIPTDDLVAISNARFMYYLEKYDSTAMTGGRVFVSSGPMANQDIIAGATADGTIQAIASSNFDDSPVLDILSVPSGHAVVFQTARALYAVGTIPTPAARTASSRSTITQLATFTADIAEVDLNGTNGLSANVVLTDGTAHNIQTTVGTITQSTNFVEAMTPPTGRTFMQVLTFNRQSWAIARMDNGTIYAIGGGGENSITYTATTFEQLTPESGVTFGSRTIARIFANSFDIDSWRIGNVGAVVLLFDNGSAAGFGVKTHNDVNFSAEEPNDAKGFNEETIHVGGSAAGRIDLDWGTTNFDLDPYSAIAGAISHVYWHERSASYITLVTTDGYVYNSAWCGQSTGRAFIEDAGSTRNTFVSDMNFAFWAGHRGLDTPTLTHSKRCRDPYIELYTLTDSTVDSSNAPAYHLGEVEITPEQLGSTSRADAFPTLQVPLMRHNVETTD